MRLLPWKLDMYLLSCILLLLVHLSTTQESNCRNDQKEANNQKLCYKVFSKPVKWEEALEACNKEHLFLLQFQNERTTSDMSSIIMDEKNIDFVWIGLRRISNYFQWVGMKPQLFHSVKNEWGLHWKESTEPKVWNGCGAVRLSTGELYSKSCDTKELPFVCVKPFKEFIPLDADADVIDVSIVPINDKNENLPLPENNMLWINEEDRNNIILDCQVRINGELMDAKSLDSKIKIVWSKNGIHREKPIQPSIYPNYWLNPTPWVANIGQIKDFLGTYVCEANIPFQSRRHHSNNISLFIKGTQVFRYNIRTELVSKLKIDCLEPTASKIYNKWNLIISNISNNILPINKPEVIGATKIEWMLHYIRPESEIKQSNGTETKNILISLFVTVETQSKDDDETKQQLLKIVYNFKEYKVDINIIGKCDSILEFDKGTYYLWSMKLGQNRGFSDPICVSTNSSEPEYKMISRQCRASYDKSNEWEQFDYAQCTSKVTHLMEDQFCPEGHKMVNDDFCAVNGSTDSIWKDARDECIRKGSHLPHNAYDIFAIDQIPESSWSVARLNGRKLYPGPPQNFTGQNWTECVILNRSTNPIWLGAVCTEKQPFFCLSRIQDTLWRVPWCPRGGWLGSEIPALRNTCFSINTSLILPDNMKSAYCSQKGATVTDTTNPLLYILITATVRKHNRLPNRKRHIRQTDKFVDIPFVVCQKPKGSRSPRKAELVLTHTPTTKDKYPIIELICHGINVRPNSRTVWYHNGDPYPELERMDPNLEDYLAAARVELVEARQGDYWCEAWDNNAQSTVSSNKITLIVQGVKNCVILLNTTNSHIRDVSEFSRFNNYFNQAESNIVKREATLLADGQIVIWVQEDTARTLEEVVTDVKSQFEAHLEADKLNLEPTVRSTEWCLQETTTDNENTLTWPQTRRNQASLPKEQCFTDNGNAVSRDCLGDFRQGAYWGRVRGSCTGKPNEFTGKLYELSESEVRKDNVLEASIELDQLTDSKKTKNYRPVDIAYIAKTMQKISDTENVANETLKNVVDTVNRVMNVDSKKILSSHKISRSSNRITQSLEKMIDSVPLEQGHPLEFSLPNIYIKAQILAPDDGDLVVGVSSYNKQQMTLTSADQLDYSHTDAALLMPRSLVEDRKRKSRNNGLKIYFVIYHNSKLFTTDNATVNSKVIAARLPDQSVKNQEPPIQLVFKPLQEMSMESVSCTYWDSRLNIGKGDWSTAGCRLRSIEKNRIICECTHLTNFAVLMDIYEQADRVSGTHRHILDAITYFGCAFSILGLSLTILTFLLFSKWRKKDGNKIICNLALALLLLLIVFLAGIEQTHSPTICLTVAILLHYFILSSFCWMLVEAIQQYLLFVRVLATYIPRFLLKAMVFAWGLPLIIVVTVIGIDINQYRGGHHYCWMKQDALYVSFLLPVGIIMIINAVVFILVLRGITCGRTSNLRSNQSKQQLMKTQLYAAICIFVLLGLTWVFGFLAVEKVRVTFQYIFCVCNSVQGLLIFLFMVVRDRNAHDLWSSLCATKKTKRLGTTSGLQTYTRREEANMSENCTTKLMISRTSTHSPS